MKKIFVLLFVCLFSFFEGVDALAQSVKFSNIRLEHNIPDNNNNGRKFLKFNFSATIEGCLNHKVKFYMYVETPQNQRHRYSNGTEMVSTSVVYEIKNSSTLISNLWVGIYNDTLNPLPGTNTYHTCIMAKDETTGRWLGSSSYLDFTNTGTQQNVAPSQSYTPSYTPPSSNIEIQKIERTCARCSGTGLDWDHHLSYIYHTCTDIRCDKCGQKHCSTCRHINCIWCDGTGKQTTTTFK
ncbi:MAG: hypothetical protein IKQ77_08250 [Prevotella sp.]|nr:hypothetical protein [Prevotella sp.]